MSDEKPSGGRSTPLAGGLTKSPPAGCTPAIQDRDGVEFQKEMRAILNGTAKYHLYEDQYMEGGGWQPARVSVAWMRGCSIEPVWCGRAGFS
jgi:hypothetical protein